ncbi:MAG TPA: hypothetical protein VHB73_00380 [Alphaproteobacteria bacterium]|nr:hypothetical protein [Alphaproteobacteria bacterium]
MDDPFEIYRRPGGFHRSDDFGGNLEDDKWAQQQLVARRIIPPEDADKFFVPFELVYAFHGCAIEHARRSAGRLSQIRVNLAEAPLHVDDLPFTFRTTTSDAEKDLLKKAVETLGRLMEQMHSVVHHWREELTSYPTPRRPHTATAMYARYAIAARELHLGREISDIDVVPEAFAFLPDERITAMGPKFSQRVEQIKQKAVKYYGNTADFA